MKILPISVAVVLLSLAVCTTSDAQQFSGEEQILSASQGSSQGRRP